MTPREQWNMKYYSKYEIVLLETCLLYLYSTPDWVGQYLGTYHNSVTHIYSAAAHGVYRYMEILLPWTCLQRYCKYENREIVLYSYRLQKYYCIFPQTFYFVHFEFYIWCVSDKDCEMLTGNNAYFWHKCNTHKHT